MAKIRNDRHKLSQISNFDADDANDDALMGLWIFPSLSMFMGDQVQIAYLDN